MMKIKNDKLSGKYTPEIDRTIKLAYETAQEIVDGKKLSKEE